MWVLRLLDPQARLVRRPSGKAGVSAGVLLSSQAEPVQLCLEPSLWGAAAAPARQAHPDRPVRGSGCHWAQRCSFSGDPPHRHGAESEEDLLALSFPTFPGRVAAGGAGVGSGWWCICTTLGRSKGPRASFRLRGAGVLGVPVYQRGTNGSAAALASASQLSR